MFSIFQRTDNKPIENSKFKKFKHTFALICHPLLDNTSKYLIYNSTGKLSKDFEHCTILKCIDLTYNQYYPSELLANYKKEVTKCFIEDTLEPKFITDYFSDLINCEEIIGLSNLDTSSIENMSYMFSNCHSVKKIDLSKLNMDSVNNASHMFSNCRSLKNIDVSTINTQKISNISYMFYGCTSLTSIDLSSIIIDKIKNAYKLFDECINLKKIQISHLPSRLSTHIETVTINYDYKFVTAKRWEFLLNSNKETPPYTPKHVRKNIDYCCETSNYMDDFHSYNEYNSDKYGYAENYYSSHYNYYTAYFNEGDYDYDCVLHLDENFYTEDDTNEITNYAKQLQHEEDDRLSFYNDYLLY